MNQAIKGKCINCPAFKRSIFSDGIPQELEEITKNSITLHYKKGQVIFREGDFINGSYCVALGKIKKSASEGTKSLTLNLANQGDMIGYWELIANDHHIFTAEALENTTLCLIPRKSVTQFHKCPHFLNRTIKRLSAIIENLSLKTINLSFKNKRESVANAIIELYLKFGIDKNDNIDIKITKKELADLASTTTTSAIKLTNEMAAENIINYNDGRIKILNLEKLKKVARSR